MSGIIDQSRFTYFSPQADTIDAFLKFIGTAQKKILIADYSLVWPALVSLLIQKHSAGVDVRMVLDKTQDAGKAEAPQVELLKAAGIPVAIGTSSMRHIMHLKIAVVDDSWVESGSYNYTLTAAKECNVIDIEHSPDRAAVFTAAWQAAHDFIKANEPTGIFNEQ